MNNITHHRERVFRLICLLALAAFSVETMGCSMMGSRAKAKAAASKDRFSCGESLPARNP